MPLTVGWQRLSRRHFLVEPGSYGKTECLRLSVTKHTCAPQKVDATSCSNSFGPIFMPQCAENISRSHPAIGWQLVPMDAWARGRGLLSESRVPGLKLAWGRPLIVVGNPLPQDRPQILFVLRDHTIHAFTADRSHQSFTEPLAFGACTGVVELSARMPLSHRQLPHEKIESRSWIRNRSL
jgi:hypothetical protein